MWEFEIVTIEKSQPPLHNQGGNWYRYTIANRITEITGMRKGSKTEVAQFVQASIQRLNTRHRTPKFSQSNIRN